MKGSLWRLLNVYPLSICWFGKIMQFDTIWNLNNLILDPLPYVWPRGHHWQFCMSAHDKHVDTVRLAIWRCLKYDHLIWPVTLDDLILTFHLISFEDIIELVYAINFHDHAMLSVEREEFFLKWPFLTPVTP